ncbi:hypothetical protein TM7_0040 [candidate division TM7 genomosp. GTL1]|nr:hypothetical protein TM7_0040 [candidate division TM7 genomosp. GTL1]
MFRRNNMFQFDDNFLQSVGLASMPDNQKEPFLQHIYQELQIRVGTHLSEGMSDEKLDEFQKLHTADSLEALRWLDAHRPNYKQVVAAELASLLIAGVICRVKGDIIGL